ncbi:MAG TPA: transcription antitermination factor NusB [Trueperaceae bacterium]|nr:transcription antitermination factor NusB [Trueperaceae bacterium]
MARRRARELAFRTLFQSSRGSEELLSVWASVRTELGEAGEEDVDKSYGEAYGDPLDSGGISFADSLLKSYVEHKDQIEDVLLRNVSGWSFNQMAQTDLNVLRLAVTEMYFSDNPPEVAIEMAVRLAKKFGGDESGRFVNGVLAKVYRELKNAPAEDGRLVAASQSAVGGSAEEDDLTSGS